ncbi:MAG: ABC transporter ATP-binding protein [Spirochaetales bacterium]|nr:ABC transporter ATP-binding protein [Spirochaetales bacterium]
MESMVEIRKVNKYYDDNHVVKDLDLTVGKGEFLTLLGPSGCGKTTTLRMIAGFENPCSGNIFVESANVDNKEPYERSVNTVFQSYALFPHKNIYDNIGFGLKMKKESKSEIKERVTEMLKMVQLEGFEKRMPNQLSGGQKQRVAIARALINRPKVLLLDEPLGALDLKLRKQMQIELKRLQRKLGITFIYVTHDQEEALTMSDRIAVMEHGVIEQLGTPSEIYEKPVSKFVADFIGESNVIHGTVTEILSDNLKLKTGKEEILAINNGHKPGENVFVSIRPEKIRFSNKPVDSFSLTAIVKEHVYMGSMNKCIVMIPSGRELKINRFSGEELPAVDSKIYLSWAPEDAVVMVTKPNDVNDQAEDIHLGVTT